MGILLSAVIFGAVVAMGNVLGGILALLQQERRYVALTYAIALGGGFMLAAAFLEMVPESVHLNKAYAPLLILLGYLFIHFFEHTLGEHVHLGHHEHHGKGGLLHETVGFSTLLGIAVHTFFDGAAIAAGFHVSNLIGALISGAIILHKVPEGFTVAAILLAAGKSPGQALAGASFVAATTLAGALLVGLAHHLIAIALPLSTGVMIYVAASDLIPEINEVRGFRIAAVVFVGVALFYVTRLALMQLGLH